MFFFFCIIENVFLGKTKSNRSINAFILIFFISSKQDCGSGSTMSNKIKYSSRSHIFALNFDWDQIP